MAEVNFLFLHEGWLMFMKRHQWEGADAAVQNWVTSTLRWACIGSIFF